MKTVVHLQLVLAVVLGACAGVGEEPLGTSQQAGQSLQGQSLQGQSLQGQSLQGQSLQGQSLQGIQLDGVALENARVEKGELVAEMVHPRSGRKTTLRGADLVGARLYGTAQDTSTDPPTTTTIEYRITAVEPEDPAHDPTGSGHTYLYTFEQWVPETGEWVNACFPDDDGNQHAIPVGAVWNEWGDRVETSSGFTMACTSGVIAKCYRWGYRPWLAWEEGDPDLLRRVHQACTRMARADYCGDGRSFTRDGTWINMFDILDPVIQERGEPGEDWMFEAGWNEDGAVCLARTRWVDLGEEVYDECPEKLLPRDDDDGCEGVEDVHEIDPEVVLFNDSQLNY